MDDRTINKEDTVEYIADLINAGKHGHKPPILFLGADCSSGSKCPSAVKLVRHIQCKYELDLDPHKSTFRDIERKLNQPIFNLPIHDCYQNAIPSKGYWFLAEAVGNNFFSLILSSCFDACFEMVLSKVLHHDLYNILVRGDHNDDRITESISESFYQVNIIKALGDYMTPNKSISPEDICAFDKSLRDYINRRIEDNCFIAIGLTKHDSYLLKNLSFKNKNNNLIVSNAADRPFIEKHVDCPDNVEFLEDNDFDELFRNLAWKLGGIDHAKTSRIERLRSCVLENSDDKISEILSCCNLEVGRNQIESNINKLMIFTDTHFSEATLAFIHDPDSPGGSEILKIIERKFNPWVRNKKIIRIIIQGRGAKVHERKVTGFENRDKQAIDYSYFINDQKLLMIDCISFSGGTLRKCRNVLDDLFKRHGDPARKIGAATLFAGPNLLNESELIHGLFNKFFSAQDIKSHQILFPWGYASSTEAIFPEDDALKSLESLPLDEFIPHNLFGFRPRPWGSILTLSENQFVSVKILSLNPGEKLSKHRHHIRDEIFLVLDEHITLQIWDTSLVLRKGDSFRIPSGVVHRLVALNSPCRILEIAYKYYDQVDDIERFDDKYNRENERGNV